MGVNIFSTFETLQHTNKTKLHPFAVYIVSCIVTCSRIKQVKFSFSSFHLGSYLNFPCQQRFFSWCSLTGEKRPLPWVQNGFDLTTVHCLGRHYLRNMLLALFADCNLSPLRLVHFFTLISAVIYSALCKSSKVVLNGKTPSSSTPSISL